MKLSCCATNATVAPAGSVDKGGETTNRRTITSVTILKQRKSGNEHTQALREYEYEYKCIITGQID